MLLPTSTTKSSPHNLLLVLAGTTLKLLILFDLQGINMDSQQTSTRVLGVRYQNISLFPFLQALEFLFVRLCLWEGVRVCGYVCARIAERWFISWRRGYSSTIQEEQLRRVLLGDRGDGNVLKGFLIIIIVITYFLCKKTKQNVFMSQFVENLTSPLLPEAYQHTRSVPLIPTNTY